MKTEGDRGNSIPADPLVTLRLGKEEVEFLVDTGAIYSVFNTCKRKLSRNVVVLE